MTEDAKLRQGTTAWFEMVGALLCEAAMKAGLSPTLNLSLVERYTDGVTLPGGINQGLRFDIRGGVPSFRVGVSSNERADATIHVTAAAARTLNSLLSTDPDYPTTTNGYLATGEMRVDGNITPFEAWFSEVHDPIVDRTANFQTAHLPTEVQGGPRD